MNIEHQKIIVIRHLRHIFVLVACIERPVGGRLDWRA
jgi:hypothetical protein